MGPWGFGPFENDDALDFAAEIESVDDLTATLKRVVDDEEMEADLACRIVVVAECVAAMHGHRHKDMPPELATRMHGFGKPSADLYELSRKQLSRAISSSELAVLWGESDDRGEWNREMHDLIERLNAPIKHPGKARKKRLEPNSNPCMICDEAMGEDEFSMFDICLDSG